MKSVFKYKVLASGTYHKLIMLLFVLRAKGGHNSAKIQQTLAPSVKGVAELDQHFHAVGVVILVHGTQERDSIVKGFFGVAYRSLRFLSHIIQEDGVIQADRQTYSVCGRELLA